MAALGFEVLFGALTVTGSFMAFGKLQEFLPGRPVTYKGQNAVNIAAFVGAVGLWLYLVADPTATWAFWAMTVTAFVIGVSLVLPIGGADMPVVISLLNSYAGLAASARSTFMCPGMRPATGWIANFTSPPRFSIRSASSRTWCWLCATAMP